MPYLWPAMSGIDGAYHEKNSYLLPSGLFTVIVCSLQSFFTGTNRSGTTEKTHLLPGRRQHERPWHGLQARKKGCGLHRKGIQEIRSGAEGRKRLSADIRSKGKTGGGERQHSPGGQHHRFPG